MAVVWERQKGESFQAYQAFLVYLDLGPERTLEKVAKKLNSSRMLQSWFEKCEWERRAKAYDTPEVDKGFIGNVQDDISNDMLNDYHVMLKAWQKQFNARSKNTSNPITADEMTKFAASRKSIDDLGRRVVGLPAVVKPPEPVDDKNPFPPEAKAIQFRIPGKVKSIDEDE